MSSASTPAYPPQRAVFLGNNGARRPVWLAAIILGVVWLAFSTGLAQAQSLGQGVAAFNRQDYVVAARILTPYAERGAPSAQAYLGFMYETGRMG